VGSVNWAFDSMFVNVTEKFRIARDLNQHIKSVELPVKLQGGHKAVGLKEFLHDQVFHVRFIELFIFKIKAII
jgi:hypothetical protein